MSRRHYTTRRSNSQPSIRLDGVPISRQPVGTHLPKITVREPNHSDYYSTTTSPPQHQQQQQIYVTSEWQQQTVIVNSELLSRITTLENTVKRVLKKLEVSEAEWVEVRSSLGETLKTEVTKLEERIKDTNDRLFRVNERWKKQVRHQNKAMETLKEQFASQIEIVGCQTRPGSPIASSTMSSTISTEGSYLDDALSLRHSIDDYEYLKLFTENRELIDNQQEQLEGISKSLDFQNMKLKGIEMQNMDLSKQNLKIDKLISDVNEQKLLIQTLENKMRLTEDHSLLLTTQIENSESITKTLDVHQSTLESIHSQLSELTGQQVVFMNAQEDTQTITAKQQLQFEEIKADVMRLTTSINQFARIDLQQFQRVCSPQTCDDNTGNIAESSMSSDKHLQMPQHHLTQYINQLNQIHTFLLNEVDVLKRMLVPHESQIPDVNQNSVHSFSLKS